MPELRRDLIHDTWVLIATEQALEPKYFPINKNGTYVRRTKVCPFCGGNESLTPPEIAAFRNQDSCPDEPGWLVFGKVFRLIRALSLFVSPNIAS